MKHAALVSIVLIAVLSGSGARAAEDPVGCSSWLGLLPVQTRFDPPSEAGQPAGYSNMLGVGGCTFTAKKAGGYNLSPSATDLAAGYWYVRVERGDQVITYSRDRSAWCADEVIKRGDRVFVWAVVGASAGQSSGCS